MCIRGCHRLHLTVQNQRLQLFHHLGSQPLYFIQRLAAGLKSYFILIVSNQVKQLFIAVFHDPFPPFHFQLGILDVRMWKKNNFRPHIICSNQRLF